jgi:hypothetical protein
MRAKWESFRIMERSKDDPPSQERREGSDPELEADFDHELRLSDFHMPHGEVMAGH